MSRAIAALVRHGDYHQLPQTPSAHQPFPLTALGEKQARQAANSIRQMLNTNAWSLAPCINCSQLLRAWQTAVLINKELSDRSRSDQVEVKCFDNLAERGLGSAANLTIEQIETVISNDPRFDQLPPDWKSNSHFRLPLQGAESLLDAGKRVAEHLNAEMARAAETLFNRDTLKIFVGHGAAFRHAAYHLGVLDFEDIARLSMFHAEPVYLEFTAEKQWHHIAGEWKIRNTAEDQPD